MKLNLKQSHFIRETFERFMLQIQQHAFFLVPYTVQKSNLQQHCEHKYAISLQQNQIVISIFR